MSITLDALTLREDNAKNYLRFLSGDAIGYRRGVEFESGYFSKHKKEFELIRDMDSLMSYLSQRINVLERYVRKIHYETMVKK